jgi:hypothetical protein
MRATVLSDTINFFTMCHDIKIEIYPDPGNNKKKKKKKAPVLSFKGMPLPPFFYLNLHETILFYFSRFYMT